MTARSWLASGGVALVLLGVGDARAEEPQDRSPKQKGHRLVLTGVWMQPGCVPTAFTPDVATQSAQVSCTGVATYSGQLNGYAKQQITARANASTTTARIVADIYGRTSDNLCGSLRLEPEHAEVNATGATGVGPITSGTGDFAGVTGWYDTSGVGVGGFGQGGYRITLDFPTKAAPTPAATPCVPPAPLERT